jgi:23S rRNA (cytosine1962-C5)-methyltransferase
MDDHPLLLANRIRKNFRRLHPRLRSVTNAFRVYDWDIPEVRCAVDWYDGAAVVHEYRRTQTDGGGYLDRLCAAAARGLDIDREQVFGKSRRTGSGARYGRLDDREITRQVMEHGLHYVVNLSDHIDVGLFLDQRPARRRLLDEAAGHRVLNLFAYTGSFSVCAAAGGAAAVTTVDRTAAYLAMFEANAQLNALPMGEVVCSDAARWLDHAQREDRRWDLIIVDPPSYSGQWRGRLDFTVERDHGDLLESVSRVCAPDARVWLSVNHQRFELRDHPGLAVIQETTSKTVPEDFRRRSVHRSWELRPVAR